MADEETTPGEAKRVSTSVMGQRPMEPTVLQIREDLSTASALGCCRVWQMYLGLIAETLARTKRLRVGCWASPELWTARVSPKLIVDGSGARGERG